MDFLSIGPTELLFIIVIALIVLGPARMIEVARSLGKILREIRRTTSELPSLLSPEERPGESSSETRRKGRAQRPGSDGQEESESGEG